MGNMGLTTRELYVLEMACRPVWDAFPNGGTYLVGTAQTGREFRDVDVRTILPDKDFDRLFHGQPELWELMCLTTANWLVQQTGLRIDYQIQRMTQANERHDGQRNPVGMGSREYAGLGDGTDFKDHGEDYLAYRARRKRRR